MYWKNLINNYFLINNSLKKKLISSNLNYNIKKKKLEKIKLLELEEKLKFLENLEVIKKKFKLKNENDIANWDSYKKKYKFTKKQNMKKTYNILFLSLKNLKKVTENTKYFNLSINVNNVIDKFEKINLKKTNNISIKSDWCIKNPLFVIIDVRSLKTKIILFNKLKCISTITNGIVFKKLQFNHKKYKKSEKLSFLALKMIILNTKNYINNKNLIIQLKGLKKISKNIISYFNELVKKINVIGTIYINNYKISNNTYFKFKKVKSIKRRLKKKIIKLN